MAIETSDLSFNDLDRERKEAEAARQSATLEHLAVLVIYRDAERLKRTAEIDGIDLTDAGVRQDILTRVATLVEDSVEDYGVKCC